MWELACLRLRRFRKYSGNCHTAIAGKPAPTFDCIHSPRVAVFETRIGIRQFAVILAALLWSQYEFVADR